MIQHIINAGVSKDQNLEETKRIRLSNLITLTVFTTGTPFVFLFYLYGSPISGISLGLYVLSFLVVIRLNYKKRHMTSKMLMLGIMNTAVIHYAVWYGAESGLHNMLIPFACVPFLVFSRNEKMAIVFNTAISIGGYILIDFIPFHAILELDELSLSIIYHAITIIALTWIVLEMLYLSNQNYFAITELNRQKKNQTAAIVHAQESDRERISRDLHDSIGQLLSTIKINLQRSNSSETALTETIGLIDRTVTEIRNISFNLMPHTLENEGLVSALNELVASLKQLSEYTVWFHAHDIDTIAIRKDQQYNIYRIIQEATNNILKHANATEIVIQLIKVKNQLTITIEDNGKGFFYDQRSKGNGLGNIAARAEWLDGFLKIDSREGNGTTLIVAVPIDALTSDLGTH